MAFDATLCVATVAEVKDFLRKSDDQDLAVLDAIANGVGAYFKSATGRQFIVPASDATVKMDGTGDVDLWLPDYPIVSVTSIKELGITLVKDTDFYQYDPAGRLRRAGHAWTDEPQGVEVVYKAGYAVESVPQDLKMAFMVQVAELWKRFRTQSWGETNRTLAQQSVTLPEEDILPLVKSVLWHYRRHSL